MGKKQTRREAYLARAKALRQAANEVPDSRGKTILLSAARVYELMAEGKQPDTHDWPPESN